MSKGRARNNQLLRSALACSMPKAWIPNRGGCTIWVSWSVDFLSQAAQFAFQLLDALAQGHGLVVPTSGELCVCETGLCAAALFDHLAHRARLSVGQPLDGISVAAHVGRGSGDRCAGQLAQLGQHALDRGLRERFELGPLLAQATLALAGGRQQPVTTRAPAPREPCEGGIVDGGRLAHVPRVVLGQVDGLRLSSRHRPPGFVEEVTAVFQRVWPERAGAAYLANALGVSAVAA